MIRALRHAYLHRRRRRPFTCQHCRAEMMITYGRVVYY